MRLAELLAISGLAGRAPFYLADCAAAYQPACCAFVSRRELAEALPQDASLTVCAKERPGIYLPDVYASDFYWLEQRHNYLSTLAYMRMTNDLVALDIANYELVFAAFVLLHEYGHWLHFRRYRRGSLAYIQWLNRQLAPIERQAALLAKIPDGEPLKEELLAQHIDAYNAMPQEFSANKYALKHLPALYNKLLSN